MNGLQRIWALFEHQLSVLSPLWAACYCTILICYIQFHDTCLHGISSLCHSFSRLRFSIQQSQLFFFFFIAPWRRHGLPSAVTILRVSYYPSLLFKRTSLNKKTLLFSSLLPRFIHGSFDSFNGLDSTVSVIGNLTFPSLKTWSISLVGSVGQTCWPSWRFLIWISYTINTVPVVSYLRRLQGPNIRRELMCLCTLFI